jgi:hypothetical protein
MTDKIRFLASKGKYTSKENLDFYASASLEKIERAEKKGAYGGVMAQAVCNRFLSKLCLQT